MEKIMSHEEAGFNRKLNSRNYSSDAYAIVHPRKWWRRITHRALRHLYKSRDERTLRDERGS
jgi:hypothetical protein